MAKEVIFVVSWLRPLKLIGLANLLCGIIAFILSMVLEDWVLSDESDTHRYYMSLWKRCIKLPPPVENEAATPAIVEGEWECKDSRVLGSKFIHSVILGMALSMGRK